MPPFSSSHEGHPSLFFIKFQEFMTSCLTPTHEPPQIRNLLQEVVFSWQKSRQWTQLRLAQGWLHLASPPGTFVSKKNAGNRKLKKPVQLQMPPTNSTKWAFTAAFLAAAFFFLFRLRLLGLSQVEESRSRYPASPQPKTSSSGSSFAAGSSGAQVLGRHGGWKLAINGKVSFGGWLFQCAVQQVKIPHHALQVVLHLP